MPSKSIDISDAKIQLKELVSLAEKGTEVILTDQEKPVARLEAVAKAQVARVAGLHKGSMRTTVDFDEPLPEGFWVGNQ